LLILHVITTVGIPTVWWYSERFYEVIMQKMLWKDHIDSHRHQESSAYESQQWWQSKNTRINSTSQNK